MTTPQLPSEPSTIPPYPSQPPTAGTTRSTRSSWWRDDSVPDDVPPPPTEPPTAGGLGATAHIPSAFAAAGFADAASAQADAAAMHAAAEAFWGQAGKVMGAQFAQAADLMAHRMGEQIGQVGEQVHQLLTETEAQRAARQQVAYEELAARQRAERDAAFAAAGETTEQRTERHRVEKILDPGPLQRTDLVGLVDMLSARITETPEERAARLEADQETDKRRRRAREDAERAAAGETPEQRTRRHRQQALADKREAATRARRARRQAARAAGPSDRTKRFRRWCVLTAISATGGYVTGLIGLVSIAGPLAGIVLTAVGLALDLWVRDHGRQRISEVTRPWPLTLLVLARIPVASGLVVATGLAPLFPALHPFN
ncbi:hypothetical protein ACFYS8_36270 [Kitasatospora sp. NPDC004615]|uniref:hypothetical protein n=1 Tax=Kitasatospora sp. NPDC004615 TaxID=3364017 RepID=UPI0036BDA78A